MGKPSRRQRKQLREKRVRAEDLGFAITQATDANDRSRHERPSRLSESGAGEVAGKQLVSSTGVAPKAEHWWSSWPMSIKLLLVGILTLIAIGLYRRYTEDSVRSGDGSGNDVSLMSKERSDRAEPPASGSVDAGPVLPPSATTP